jgi:hypothetical protein
MTVGLSPSMIATTELVVPRSMPMIFPMMFLQGVAGALTRPKLYS